MDIMEGLHTLWDSTGIMGFVHAAQNAVAALAWHQETI